MTRQEALDFKHKMEVHRAIGGRYHQSPKDPFEVLGDAIRELTAEVRLLRDEPVNLCDGALREKK